MPATIIFANAALDLIFGGAAWPARPATLYFGLFTVLPTIAGGGVEVTGGNYSRKPLTANTSNFTDPASPGDNLSTAVAIEWPRASASWGEVCGWGIFSAATSGDLLWYEPVTTPVTIATGQTPSIASGALTFSLSGTFGNTIEQRLLRHFFRSAAWTTVSSQYLALFTAAPTSAGGGTECSGNNYQRRSLTNNSTSWPAAAAGLKSNGTQLSFAAFTPAGVGTVSHWGIYDASTTGNLLWYGSFNTATVTTPATYSAEIGSLTVSLVG